jgi:lysophospholipase L1-like esterase
MPLRFTLLPAALAAALLLPGAAEAATPAPKPDLYVSLGDSYASGYQPTAVGKGRNTRHGFAYQVPGSAKKRGYALKLVNFGCGGATTTSLLRTKSCPPRALGPGGEPYPKATQLHAAELYLRAHRGEVALITVSIGGNDVTSCARGAGDPVACVAAAVKTVDKNVRQIAERLRKAAGPKVRITGTTYPDVILGAYLSPDQKQKDLAKLSIAAFKSLVNPTLEKAYASAKGRFVDVTAATGAYGPFDAMTDLPPYGSIPTPVAKVCRLTYFCEFGDIHSRTAGYKIIADLVAGTLPRRHR